jgi:catechol 2,3-dioxygenase-like lactoylglutathione lyase family enzyme
MIEPRGVAHFSISVTDMDKSLKFYTDIMGCRHLFTNPPGTMSFVDAAGMCLILCKQDATVNPSLHDHNGVHHSFLVDSDKYQESIKFLEDSGVEVFFEEDRQGGVVNGPRAYFRDPDGTVLEIIDLTGYMGAE